MRAAFARYEMLPESLKDQIHELCSLQVHRHLDAEPEEDLRGGNPSTVQPIVKRHERTGKMYLHVCEQFVERVETVPSEESQDILRAIFTVMYGPGNVYDHWWEPDDLLIWIWRFSTRANRQREFAVPSERCAWLLRLWKISFRVTRFRTIAHGQAEVCGRSVMRPPEEAINCFGPPNIIAFGFLRAEVKSLIGAADASGTKG